MIINGMVAITPRGKKPVLYLTRSDVPKVQALQLSGTNVALTGGGYDTRPTTGHPGTPKHSTKMIQDGVCAEGTYCTAVLTLVMDDRRELSFAVRGPFDRNQGILFYQEVRPEVGQWRESYWRVRSVSGLDVELRNTEHQFVERG